MSAVGSVIEDITVITAHLLTNTKKVYETSYIEETTLHSCYKAPADLPACIDPAEARFIPQVTTQLPKMDDFSEGTSSKLSPSVEPSFSENKAVDNSAAAQARAIGLFTWVTSTVTLTSVTAVVPHPDQTVTVTWEGCSPSTLPLTLEECTSSDGIDEGMDGTSDENGESGMDGSGDYEIPTSYPSYRTLEEIE
ncbi:hypothetical protein SK128_016703 [Halocaridina rubra]|uniref:Uncharacterized protein n=1 Tax=Halocaridina rubra TaxID=373956 RepID=A0AAN9A383_HALRR